MLYYFTCFLLIVYATQVTKRSLHMMQQNLYNENNRYLKWVWKNKNATLINLSLINIFLAVVRMITDTVAIDTAFLGIISIITIASFFLERRIELHNQNKKPLVYTARIKRMLITFALLYSALLAITILNPELALFIMTVLSSLTFLTTYLILLINLPVEKMVYHYYEMKAKNKLASMTNLNVIGITGSYGKTSCKNILNDILSIKFNTLSTAKSINTFNGIMITINNQLSKFDEIFITEMGAYVQGEIQGLCQLVNPKYGIITSIGSAHLETFGSEENIQKGKMELIEALPCDGIGILNRDDPMQTSYTIRNKCRILWIGIENQEADIWAHKIVTEGVRTHFEIYFKDSKKSYSFETKLLGKHNIYNILSAVALGYALKIPVELLQTAVKRVRAIEHRLELKKIGSFYQIDDAYNSNPIGAKSALEVLANMDGCKIVVTPGMIELGKKQDELNREFGRQIKEIANPEYAVLIGQKQTRPIYEGLLEAGFSKDRIRVLKDVRESYSFIQGLKEKKDIYALYENDLPDTYNE